MNEKKLVVYNERKLIINNVLSDSVHLHPFVQEIGKELALSSKLENSLTLALEEALVNAIYYAYPEEAKGTITLLANWDANSYTLRFSLIDQGTPFNPLIAPDADITLSLHDRPIGGLGIFLIKQIMDKVEYKYEDGSNHLLLWKYIE